MRILKAIAAIVIICSAGQSVAKDRFVQPTAIFESTKLDSTLTAGQSKYIFWFRNIPTQEVPINIQYSIDGIAQSGNISAQMNIEITSAPGKHVFQFFYNSDYYEIYSDSLEVLNQHIVNYGLYFEPSRYQIMSEKPIIYLYPEEEMSISVKLDVAGELTFTYPDYGTGWDFTANPNGDLSFGDNTYNYLFWESSEKLSSQDIILNEGFRVEGKNATSFLKEKLTEAGLTSKEMTDFITYWGPRLAQNEANYVQYKFNEECNKFAELNITPKPDNLYRIYILWHPATHEIELDEQKIISINRKGFTVLEWGGQELPSRNDRSQLNH